MVLVQEGLLKTQETWFLNFCVQCPTLNIMQCEFHLPKECLLEDILVYLYGHPWKVSPVCFQVVVVFI